MSYRLPPTEPRPPRRPYPSDLSDGQWAHIAPLLPQGRPRGQVRIWPLRELVDACMYVLHNGGVWRALPHDLPPLADGVDVLPTLARRRDVATGARRPASAGAGSRRA